MQPYWRRRWTANFDDLFYRLNVIALNLPPLRERREDISLLVDYLLKRYAEMNGRNITGISADVLGVLEAYNWPGDVRELEHLIECATIFDKGIMLSRSSLPEELFSRLAEDEKPLSLEADEKRVIAPALALSGGNMKRAASTLKISRTTLHGRVGRYGLDPKAVGGISRSFPLDLPSRVTSCASQRTAVSKTQPLSFAKTDSPCTH